VGEPASVFGRRLPTLAELKTSVGDQRFHLAPAGELTSDVIGDGAGGVAVIVMAPNGSTTTVPDTGDGPRPFRCVDDPTNVID
jgi:hypothetical protein